jgi:hypothetical protein
MKYILTFIFIIYKSYSFGQINFDFKQNDSVVKYFHQVACGSEYDSSNIYFKYFNDIKIYVPDSNDTVMFNELKLVINEINEILKNIKIYIVNDIEMSNIVIHFKSEKDIINYDNEIKTFFENNKNAINLGISFSYVLKDQNPNKISKIVNSKIWVSNEVDFKMKQHVLREELVQSLGLMNDVKKYPNSIFYKGFSFPTEYSQLDKELINMLYNQTNN